MSSGVTHRRKKWKRSVRSKKLALPAKNAPRTRDTSGVGVYLGSQELGFFATGNELSKKIHDSLGYRQKVEIVQLLHVAFEPYKVKVAWHENEGLT